MSLAKFREWKRRSSIKINYVDANGQKGIWTANQAQLLATIRQIIKDYSADNIRLTSRQLYYQLVGKELIPNAEAVYKKICTFLVDARYAGLIDWDAIEDRARQVSMPSEWDNVSSLIESAISSYRLPRWQDQDYYIELFCEKQALESVLKPISRDYHVHFGANKGYSSASIMYELAQRVREQIENGKIVKILYFGDHDPSGLDMVRDIRERVYEFLFEGEFPVYVDVGNMDFYNKIQEPEDVFEVIPVALNMGQVKQYNLVPNPAKKTDSRYIEYQKRYGVHSWELDAIEPKILRMLAEQAILKWLDTEKYNAWIDKESIQKQAIKKMAEKIDKKSEGNNNGNSQK